MQITLDWPLWSILGGKILFLHKYSCPAHEVAARSWDCISGSAWLSPSGICKPSLDESQVPTNAEAVLTSGSGSESKKGSGRLQINAWPIDQMIRINIRTKTQDRYHDHYIRMRKRLRNRIKARMAPLSKSWHRFNKCMAWEPHLNAAHYCGQSFALFAFASLSKVFPMKHKEFKPIVVLWKLRWHQLVGFPVNWRHWHTNRRSCHSTATTLVCLQKHTYFLQISNTNTLFKK